MAEPILPPPGRPVSLPDRVPSEQTAVCRLAHVLIGAACRPLWGPQAEGVEHLPPTGRVILAFNHRHWMDTLVVPLIVQKVRYPRFLGKEELFRNPALGWLMRQLGIIPLNRRRGDVAALRQATAVLEEEGCLALYPEGTRSRTGAPGRAKPGVAFLAQQTGAPVVPGRLFETDRFPEPVTMRLKFGPALRYSGDGGKESCQAFADKVLETILSL
ncbi:MAG: 1-acyl-sn-glycerol-3-phosphate acyltransferase [Elusimicrobia bacterium]|nr:1-acyl-sn-glycerol-3-phosphate acyltransferase [Elusimicrobiota bacterium]